MKDEYEDFNFWSYSIRISPTKAMLDDMGARGWELVGVTVGPMGDTLAWLKRPLNGADARWRREHG